MEKVICFICGKQFEEPNYQTLNKRKFCCRRCAYEWKTENQLPEQHKRQHKMKVRVMIVEVKI